MGAIVEPSWGHFGSLLGPLGALLGPSWGALGALLGLSGRPWRLSWAILEAIDQKRGRFEFRPPLRGPKNLFVGPSWGALGHFWDRIGALLGPSWGPLGPFWSYLEASEAHRKRKGEKATTIDVRYVFKDLGFGRILGGLRGHFEPPWVRLGAS